MLDRLVVFSATSSCVSSDLRFGKRLAFAAAAAWSLAAAAAGPWRAPEPVPDWRGLCLCLGTSASCSEFAAAPVGHGANGQDAEAYAEGEAASTGSAAG